MAIYNLNPQLSNTEDIRSTPATATSVSVSATSTSLAAVNSSRRFVSFYNEGPATIFLTEGTGPATTTTYSVQVPQGFLWTPDGLDIYTGAYSAITSSGTAKIMVTQA